MSIHIDEDALNNAANDMKLLQERNDRLRTKLENMFKNLTEALDTPAGHAIEWAGKDVLLQPIDDMSKVLKHMSDTLHIIIGKSEQGEKNKYYDKIFDEYDKLDRILKNKNT